MTQSTSQRGGRRPGSGRIQQRIRLDLDTARILRMVTTRVRRDTHAPVTPEDVVAALIAYANDVLRGSSDGTAIPFPRDFGRATGDRDAGV